MNPEFGFELRGSYPYRLLTKLTENTIGSMLTPEDMGIRGIVEPDGVEELFKKYTERTVDKFDLSGSLADRKIDKYANLCRVEADGDGYKYSFQLGWPESLGEEDQAKEKGS